MNRGTLQDLSLALAAGAVAAVSPLTSQEFGVSLATGIAVGGGLLAYRTHRRRRGSLAEPDPRSGLQVPPLSLWVCAAALVALLWPTLAWMYGQWTTSLWTNSHGVFVPLVMGYLGWLALREDPAPGEHASPWGFAFAVPALVMVVLDASVRTYYLAAAGLVLLLPGLSLLVLGATRTRALAVTWLVGIFMIPVPDTPATHLYLRGATAAGVEPLLRGLGFPIVRDGTLIEIPSGIFLVSDACSGFATVYAAVGVAVVMSLYTRSHLRRAALLLSALPLALAANVVRVLILILLTHAFGSELLDTPIHEASGVATFWVVLLALWNIGDPIASTRDAQ